MVDCKKCGKCCSKLKLEIMELDLIREPKLRYRAVELGNNNRDIDNPFNKAYMLPSPCPFYVDGNCIIYDTRPNLCVAFGDKCLNKKELGE
jgi:Fe-S-cluster containining protein